MRLPIGYGSVAKPFSLLNLRQTKVQFLVSAGEASGDLYASGVIFHLKSLLPGLTCYGCAGPRLQAAGVEPVIDAAEISVVGLAEVVAHLPRIYGKYRQLVNYVRRNPPAAALLTDNPDFNLRLARQLKRLQIPVFYLVAPQVWAWRQGRVKIIRELVDKLFCLFPFEEDWFRQRGVDATYIGHPLANLVRPAFSRAEFLGRHDLALNSRLLVLLPGSRPGEIARHLPVLLETVAQLRRRFDLGVLLATPKGFGSHTVLHKFRERIAPLSIKVIENETWDCIAHASVALAASGTVTMEAAVLGTPMVTFYKVNPLSWYAGRHLVKAPFLSMVNLIAEKRIVPELIQHDMTPSKLAAAAEELLTDEARADRMRSDLLQVRQLLSPAQDPLANTARSIANAMQTAQSRLPLGRHDFVRETMN
ncbi:MAG TPA: lipid-A-disaccharide synthase [Bryobacteraceae bacterium]|nr:lipid-A-disaccharide synthase [Bryobacteraceae bacterium]